MWPSTTKTLTSLRKACLNACQITLRTMIASTGLRNLPFIWIGVVRHREDACQHWCSIVLDQLLWPISFVKCENCNWKRCLANFEVWKAERGGGLAVRGIAIWHDLRVAEKVCLNTVSCSRLGMFVMCEKTLPDIETDLREVMSIKSCVLMNITSAIST